MRPLTAVESMSFSLIPKEEVDSWSHSPLATPIHPPKAMAFPDHLFWEEV
jgi:hypothetical protein